MSTGQIVPTKGNLISTKKSLDLARNGYELMDRKRNILIRETMALIDAANEIQNQIDATYAEAYLALQNANVTLGVIDDMAAAVPIENGVSMSFRSIMGVEVPTVSLNPQPLKNYFGYSETNSALDEAYVKFDQVKNLTAKLCEIENTIYRLANGIKKTQKRANALKNVIIPRFETTVTYITNALEEKDREEFSRMKVIKNNKKN